MDLFRRKIDFTPTQYTKNDLSLLNDKFDKFIVGSDQVWNGICTNYDETYFLNFVSESKKKNSYAASFGKDILTLKECEIYAALLRDFNYLSVREEKAAKLIYSLIHREIKVVLDPVFLVEKNEWEKMETKITGRYIFLFQYINDIDTIRYASEIAQKRGIKLYIYSSNVFARKYGQIVANIGIEEFLGYIHNAELIITDSFHCSAFSIIFNRPFFSKFRKNDPANTRLYSLMHLFGIENRELCITNINANIDINYNKVNQRLNVLRAESMSYLKDICEG